MQKEICSILTAKAGSAQFGSVHILCMALKREDAKKKLRKHTANGWPYYIYYFDCKECGVEINSQHQYLKNHSGLCRSCTQKGPDLFPAYNNLVNNRHAIHVPVELTYEEFILLASDPKCHYCDKELCRTSSKSKPNYRAYMLDRKDNSKSYSFENCVPCCWSCNQIKGSRFSYEEFLKIAVVIRDINQSRSLDKKD
jgi:hypothetical protein